MQLHMPGLHARHEAQPQDGFNDADEGGDKPKCADAHAGTTAPASASASSESQPSRDQETTKTKSDPSGASHAKRDSPDDDTCNETEVLSIWPEGPDLVVERARAGAGRCSDVEVEVLHGAALPRSAAGGGPGAGAAAGAIRERAHALWEHVEEIKADLAKRF